MFLDELRSWRPIVSGLVLLAGCGCGAVLLWVWRGSAHPGPEQSATRWGPSLVVKVFHHETKPWLPIDQPGALPARAGAVRAEVTLDRPAYSYLLLLTSQGEVVPLYPWNEGPDLKVLDVDAPPPLLRERTWANPRKANFGWEMDDKPGLETLLLLLREEPLPPGLRLRQLLGEVPAGEKAPLRGPGEAALLGLAPGAKGPATLLSCQRGLADRARAIDEPLAQVMARLRETFVVQRAARFAHVGE